MDLTIISYTYNALFNVMAMGRRTGKKLIQGPCPGERILTFETSPGTSFDSKL